MANHGNASGRAEKPVCFPESTMKQTDLVRRLARDTGLSRAAAADRLDQFVAEILERLRRGQVARIPGVGTLPPGGQQR